MSEDRYEASLCNALFGIFEGGARELPDIVAGLNESGIDPHGSGAWTGAMLCAELARLGNTPVKPQRPTPIRVSHDFWPAREADGIDNGRDENRIETLLKLGLRNRWYGIAGSHEITDQPVGVMRLGERLVLWRDEEGTVRAVEDRCPHRGIALSIGSVADGNLRCRYHGVEVDRDGVVLRVPAFPECPMVGRKMIGSYPTFEHYQMVWAWFGDDAHPEPAPLELPEELTSPDWSGPLHTNVWKGHYQYVYDNIADPMHGSYLHGTTYMQERGSRVDRVKLAETAQGFELFREGQRDTSFDWMEFVDTGEIIYMRARIGFPPGGGPGGPLCIVFCVTPVDETETKIFAYRFRNVSGWQSDLYHFMYKHRFRAFMDAVLAQDEMALAAMPAWPPRENLYQHDIGLARIRRHFRQQAEAQAQELAAT